MGPKMRKKEVGGGRRGQETDGRGRPELAFRGRGASTEGPSRRRAPS